MTIDEAVKLLEDSSGLGYKYTEYGLDQALKLGIEALKRFQVCRSEGLDYPLTELPGETKE